jgi:putative CocE/NonD family hydrolase
MNVRRLLLAVSLLVALPSVEAAATPSPDPWPDGLEGAFELAEVRHVSVEMDDGVSLDGWIGLPALPEGVHAPVSLHVTPYIGDCDVAHLIVPCDPTPDDPRWFASDPPEDYWPRKAWGVPPERLIRNGYAAAFFSMRGTGGSGGCWDEFGPTSAADLPKLIEWLAGQDWSNGRVAMGGKSAPAVAAVQAAVAAPSALKAIAVSGMVSDWYTFSHTPQGATTSSHTQGFSGLYATGISLTPALGNTPERIVTNAPVTADRVCAETMRQLTHGATDTFTDVRDEAYWNERRYIDHFDDVRAATLVAHGFLDPAGHAFQESAVWDALTHAPKRILEGQWAHDWPGDQVDWERELFSWLDHWLKDVGTPRDASVGDVEYEDDAGTWHADRAWPPADSRDEALYLSGDDVLGAPEEGGDRSLRAIGNPMSSQPAAVTYNSFETAPWAALCPDPANAAAETGGVVYMTAPLAEPVVLAGNPFALLRIESDQPGGLVVVHLADIGPDFACVGSVPEDARSISSGAADLRFHDGVFSGHDFPIGQATPVRVDLIDLASRLEVGHRLAVIVNGGASAVIAGEYASQPYAPRLTVHTDGDDGATHVVLPIVEGSLGGLRPRFDHPARPFVPAR